MKKILQKGFTLIELLIVIGIIAILAAVVLVGIDPLDKIRAANDSKVQRDINALANAVEAYAAQNNGLYTIRTGQPGAGGAITQAELVASGDLKLAIVPPTDGRSCANYNITSSAATATVSCPLLAKKYTSNTATDTWVWCAQSGKAGPAPDINSCPL